METSIETLFCQAFVGEEESRNPAAVRDSFPNQDIELNRKVERSRHLAPDQKGWIL